MTISDLISDVCSSDLPQSSHFLHPLYHSLLHQFSLNPPISSSTFSLTSSSILPQFPSTLHPLYHSLLHQFSLNSLRLFIHFITNFFINSPSIPFDSSSTLSLTSSSILPQFPSTLHPLYHSLLHQFSLNPPIFFIHFITNFFINDRTNKRLNSTH